MEPFFKLNSLLGWVYTCDATPGDTIWAAVLMRPTGPVCEMIWLAPVVFGCPEIKWAIFTSVFDILLTIVIFWGAAKSIGYIFPVVTDLSFSKLLLIVESYTSNTLILTFYISKYLLCFITTSQLLYSQEQFSKITQKFELFNDRPKPSFIKQASNTLHRQDNKKETYKKQNNVSVAFYKIVSIKFLLNCHIFGWQI